MAVLIQTFAPGLTSATYDATSAVVKAKLDGFDGFLGFHAAAVVDGGMQITEAWATEAAYRTWISSVIATKLPAEAVAAMETTVTPLHNVELLTSSLTHA